MVGSIKAVMTSILAADERWGHGVSTAGRSGAGPMSIVAAYGVVVDSVNVTFPL
jgi:hypothetical protein